MSRLVGGSGDSRSHFIIVLRADFFRVRSNSLQWTPCGDPLSLVLKQKSLSDQMNILLEQVLTWLNLIHYLPRYLYNLGTKGFGLYFEGEDVCLKTNFKFDIYNICICLHWYSNSNLDSGCLSVLFFFFCHAIKYKRRTQRGQKIYL